MNIIEIEQASRFSWPSLEEQQLPIGVFRYAAEANRCLSTVTPNLEIWVDPQEMKVKTEKFFKKRNLPPKVRLLKGSPIDPLQLGILDDSLKIAGYCLEAPSRMMALNLDPYESESQVCPHGDGHYSAPNDWVRAWHHLRKRDHDLLPIHRVTLAKITDPCCFLLFQDYLSRPVASGFAVLHNGALGIHGIATSKHNLREGYATKLVNQLLHWGKRKGARYAYLQVESANVTALNLYTKLGFNEVYKYWYRARY